MKVLGKESVIKRNQVEHTLTERSVLEYIRHPNIVALRYAFQTRHKLYFILDYCHPHHSTHHRRPVLDARGCDG
jgi:serum/glucocorticoid-regulated kinase 2